MRYYVQRTGNTYIDKNFVGQGYSGHGEGLNNPDMQFVHMVGPAPRGLYALGQPFTHPRTGRFTMRLFPQTGTDMQGTSDAPRDGIMCHGDNAHNDRSASDGCLVLAVAFRIELNKPTDRRLTIVAEEADYQALINPAPSPAPDTSKETS